MTLQTSARCVSGTVSGPARLLRGALAALLAVGSAAAAHTVAGHYAPHWIVIGLALAVSIPVCTALASVRLSRTRLGAAVLSSQAVLHGLFALLPAPAAGDSGLAYHAHHLEYAKATPAAVTTAYSTAPHSAVPDATMGLAHLVTAVLSYAVLRRGDVMLEAFAMLLGLRPALLLNFTPVVPDAAPRSAAAVWPTRRVSTVWLEEGPRTLRGPPSAVVS